MVRRIVMIGQFSTYSHHLYIINPFHPEDLLRSHRTGDPGVAIYFAMGAVSLLGSAAWLRKRKET